MPAPPFFSASDSIALFLDVDGTLFDIVDDPAAVTSTPGFNRRLTTLQRSLDQAVAFISGRSVDEIDRIFAPLRFTAAGGHGAELRRAPQAAIETAATLPQFVVQRIRSFADRHSDLLVETKRSGVALHFRRRPDLEAASASLMRELESELGHSYRLQTGKMVLELTAAGFDKGTAIRTLMKAAPFAGRRPVFVGDDATDEAGFDAVAAASGVAIRVGSAACSTAAYELPDVNAVHDWLDAMIATPPPATMETGN